MTKEQLRQNAAAMLAFADGKPIQYRMRSDYAGDMDWRDYPDEGARLPDYQTWEYRPKPESKKRPWSKPDDVPGPVCWIRAADQSYTCAMVVGVDLCGVVNFDPSMDREDCITSWKDFIHTPMEYSLDRKTWHPCTVTE